MSFFLFIKSYNSYNYIKIEDYIMFDDKNDYFEENKAKGLFYLIVDEHEENKIIGYFQKNKEKILIDIQDKQTNYNIGYHCLAKKYYQFFKILEKDYPQIFIEIPDDKKLDDYDDRHSEYIKSPLLAVLENIAKNPDIKDNYYYFKEFLDSPYVNLKKIIVNIETKENENIFEFMATIKNKLMSNQSLLDIVFNKLYEENKNIYNECYERVSSRILYDNDDHYFNAKVLDLLKYTPSHKRIIIDYLNERRIEVEKKEINDNIQSIDINNSNKLKRL